MAHGLDLSHLPLVLWSVSLVGLRAWNRAYPSSAISSPLILNSIKSRFSLLSCKEDLALRSSKLVLDSRRRARLSLPQKKAPTDGTRKLRCDPLSYRFTERNSQPCHTIYSCSHLGVPTEVDRSEFRDAAGGRRESGLQERGLKEGADLGLH